MICTSVWNRSQKTTIGKTIFTMTLLNSISRVFLCLAWVCMTLSHGEILDENDDTRFLIGAGIYDMYVFVCHYSLESKNHSPYEKHRIQ